MSAPSGFYTRPMHLRAHHVGNWYADCPFCVGETFRATQAMAAYEAARDACDPRAARAALAAREDLRHRQRGFAIAVLLTTATLTTLVGLPVTWVWFTQINDLRLWHLAGPALLTVTAWCVRQVRKIGQQQP